MAYNNYAVLQRLTNKSIIFKEKIPHRPNGVESTAQAQQPSKGIS
jgi:hypothetical protein